MNNLSIRDRVPADLQSCVSVLLTHRHRPGPLGCSRAETGLRQRTNRHPCPPRSGGIRADDACQRAALNYSAYWVGEIPYRQCDDSFMPAPLADWHGSVLLRHLVQRLKPTHPFIDLNIHNIWALLAVRRGLTLDNPAEGRMLLERSTRILDSDRICPQSRQELTSIVYSLRADGITSTGTDR